MQTRFCTQLQGPETLHHPPGDKTPMPLKRLRKTHLQLDLS